MADSKAGAPQPSQPLTPLGGGAWRTAIWRVVLIYASFGAVWILFSDMLLNALLHDQALVERISIFKGWLYVLVTAGLLFWLLQREVRRRQTLESAQRVSQLLIDVLPQRIFFKDLDSRYLACNDHFAADVGQTPAQMLGKTDTDFYPPELAAKYKADDQRVIAEGQTLETDERYVTGGQEHWVHTVKTPIRDAYGQIMGLLGIFWDITAQRAAAEALRESEDNYRRLVENSADAIVVHRNGRILYVNPMALQLVGAASKDELIGHDLYERVHPDWREQIRQRITAVVQGAQVPLIEEQLLRMDGSAVAMEVGTTLVMFQGEPAVQSQIRDISERKRAAERLEKLNACFTSLGADPAANINRLVATCGELLGATCALYNRLNAGLLCSIGQWQTPPDFRPQDKPEGHICYDVISQGMDDLFEVHDLQSSTYATSDPNVQPYALQTYVGKAVFFGGQAVGSLCVVFQKEFAPTEDDRKILRIIAAAISLEEERQHAESALRESEKRYRNIIETLPDAIMITREGRHVYVNLAAVRLFGAANAEQLLGTSIDDRIHPDYREQVRHRVKLLQGGQAVPLLEESLLRFDGTTVDAEVVAIPITYQGVPAIQVLARDITTRKQAAAQINQLAAIVEQSAEAVLLTDTLGTILYVNPAFEHQSGYHQTEVRGRNPRFLKSGRQDADFYRAMWTSLTAGRPWKSHVCNRRKDGSLYEVEAVIAPLRDATGRTTHFIYSARDVTREVQLENQFRQAQKMETIGRLAGGVAHDFNNLLQTILGFCELLQSNTPPTDERRGDIDQVQRAATRAADLTQQLLAFSRKQMIEPRVIQLNAVIKDATKMLQKALGESITLVMELEAQLHRNKADPGQMEQILMNLCVNARDAMPKGGRITLRTENVTFGEAEAATLPQVRSGSFTLLSFSDTGHGMSADVQEHIFEPFFSTKGLGKGTGLGLAVIYGIVTQNNGWINVYSQPGQGTTFKIYLPALLGAEPEPPPEHVRLAEQAPRGRGERILLIEDEAEVRNLAAHLLQGYGYTVSIAESGVAARQQMREATQPFDALFSDIVLPDANGIALADEFRVLQPTLPVLLCSGYSDALTRWSDIGAKGYHFLQKPYPSAALLALLRHLLDERAPARPAP
jgi:PAS domain S-box-containing protein